MWIFGRRAKDIEFKNRLLVETDKKRSLRVQGLEAENDQLLQQLRQLKGAVEQAKKDLARAKSDLALAIQDESEPKKVDLVALEMPLKEALRVALAERDFYRQQFEHFRSHSEKLTDAATKYSLWAQELNRLLGESGIKEVERETAWRKFVEPLGVKFLSFPQKCHEG